MARNCADAYRATRLSADQIEFARGNLQSAEGHALTSAEKLRALAECLRRMGAAPELLDQVPSADHRTFSQQIAGDFRPPDDTGPTGLKKLGTDSDWDSVWVEVPKPEVPKEPPTE
jgi:hypothetical protein